MAQPTAADVHVVDVPLSNVSVAYIQKKDNFVAGKVFPTVSVPKQSDRIYTYPKGYWFLDQAEVRGDASESAGSGFTLSSTQYYSNVYAYHQDVGDQARANADAAIDLNRDAAEFVAQSLLVTRERDWATNYFSTGVWGTDLTPGNLWDSYTTSDPVTEVETAKTTVLQNTGQEANTIVLGYNVWAALKHHPDIVDHYKYTSSESITQDMIARLFEVERLLVCKSIYNTAVEGATASMSFAQGKHCLVCYVNPSPSLLAPSAGYNFVWSGVSGGLGSEVATYNIRMELKKADRIESEMAWDFMVMASDCGYLIDNCVS